MLTLHSFKAIRLLDVMPALPQDDSIYMVNITIIILQTDYAAVIKVYLGG